MNKHVYLAPTEEGEKLTLSPEQEHLCKVVYKKAESSDNSTEGYRFYDLWDPDENYDDDCIVVPLRSTYLGETIWPQGTRFANVIGSTKDPKKYDTWIHFYLDKTTARYPTAPPYCVKQCAADDNYYVAGDAVAFSNPCNNSWVCGGHVVLGTQAFAPAQDSIVYIVPLCHTHNSKIIAPAKRSGTGYYMKTRCDIGVLVLMGYMNDPQ